MSCGAYTLSMPRRVALSECQGIIEAQAQGRPSPQPLLFRAQRMSGRLDAELPIGLEAGPRERAARLIAVDDLGDPAREVQERGRVRGEVHHEIELRRGRGAGAEQHRRL